MKEAVRVCGRNRFHVTLSQFLLKGPVSVFCPLQCSEVVNKDHHMQNTFFEACATLTLKLAQKIGQTSCRTPGHTSKDCLSYNRRLYECQYSICT
jgi:hypothetical protein